MAVILSYRIMKRDPFLTKMLCPVGRSFRTSNQSFIILCLNDIDTGPSNNDMINLC